MTLILFISDIMDSKSFYGRKIAPIPDDCEDDDSTVSDNPSETSTVSSYAQDELSSYSVYSDHRVDSIIEISLGSKILLLFI